MNKKKFKHSPARNKLYQEEYVTQTYAAAVDFCNWAQLREYRTCIEGAPLGSLYSYCVFIWTKPLTKRETGNEAILLRGSQRTLREAEEQGAIILPRDTLYDHLGH